MAALSDKDLQALRARGIKRVLDNFGTRYIFTLQGLYWLLNYLLEAQPDRTSFTLGLFKALATIRPSPQWRELRVKAFHLPAYKRDYRQLAVYLNGSPPRKLLNTSATLAIPDSFNLLETSFFQFSKISSGVEIYVVISEEEQKELAVTECLVFAAN